MVGHVMVDGKMLGKMLGNSWESQVVKSANQLGTTFLWENMLCKCDVTAIK